MRTVRIGMVGARHGATPHLEDLGSMRGQRVEIAGICAQSRESAEACARRFGIPFVTTEFAALRNAHGYPQEMQDFVEAIATDREPLAGIDLAVDCIAVIYAAYPSAAEGRRVAPHEPRATSREPREDTP